MQINSNENIGDFVARLEREANERIVLAASIRKMMPGGGSLAAQANALKPNTTKKAKQRRRSRSTLADHIVGILRHANQFMTQPDIRKALFEKGVGTNLKNPASAISTAMLRNEGKEKLFVRGDGFTWGLSHPTFGQTVAR